MTLHDDLATAVRDATADLDPRPTMSYDEELGDAVATALLARPDLAWRIALLDAVEFLHPTS